MRHPACDTGPQMIARRFPSWTPSPGLREHWEMQTFSRKHGTMAVGRDQRLSPSGGDCRGIRRQVLHEAAGA